MKKVTTRSLRVAAQIQRELACLIRDEVDDSRIGFITLSEVEVSRDLAYAKIFVTVLGTEMDRAACLEALTQASPLLRRSLGHRLRLRNVPQIRFHYDASLEQGERLSQLIEESQSERPGN